VDTIILSRSRPSKMTLPGAYLASLPGRVRFPLQQHSNRTKLGVNDSMRTDAALKGISGKRLTYRRIGEQA